jgi:hypothetical protein
LVPGIDYTGEGTPEKPFQFGSHLQFYQASYALLKQLARSQIGQASAGQAHSVEDDVASLRGGRGRACIGVAPVHAICPINGPASSPQHFESYMPSQAVRSPSAKM